MQLSPPVVTGILSAGVAGASGSLALLPYPTAAIAALLAIVCSLVTLVDLDRFIIPDAANLAILGLGLAETAWRAVPDGAIVWALAHAGLRCLAAGGVLWLTRFLYRRVTKRDGLGLGDVKLAAASGACLGWEMLPLALQLAVVFAFLGLAMMALFSRRMPDRHAALPFGAALAPAIWAAFVLERW